jgi:hypothetical protein
MKITILFFILSLTFCVSCNKTENKYYNLDHSKWFKYRENDTLIFKSSNNSDFYIISQILNNYNIVDKHVYYESFTVVYKGSSSCQNCPISGFGRVEDNITLYGNLHTSKIYYNSSAMTNYQLGDSIINTVFSVDIPTDDTLYFRVKSIYYSDIYGIIRYDMYNDEVFELQLK